MFVINDPVISIVIPSYNGQKFIKEAIDSVISQSYKNWELILVDDGSKDQTAEIMKKYCNQYTNIFFCQHIKNLGVSSALNTGFKKAKGCYHSWISDDNIFKNDALEIMVKEIMSSDNIDIVYTNHDIIDEKGLFINTNKAGEARKIVFRYVIGPCFLYKSSCYVKTKGYNTDYRMCEDYDFFLRLYYLGCNFKHIDKSLFLFRRHQSAMSNNIKSLVSNTEKIIISNAFLNIEQLSKKDLSKIFLVRFLTNKCELRTDFLFKSFLYHPLYFFFRIPKIIARFLLRNMSA